MQKNKIILSLFLCYSSILFSAQTSIFQSQLSPAWYPRNTPQLKEMLKMLDLQAKADYDFTCNGSQIRAIILPHAGYRASGEIGAAACRLLDKKQFKKVILLALLHQAYGTKTPIALLPPVYQKYHTPLGDITLQHDESQKLITQFPQLFSENSQAFTFEHSMEIELPLLQYYLTDFNLLPLLIGYITDDQIKRVSEILKPLIDSETLVVVSSDFTHYGASYGYTPFKDHVQERLRMLNSQVISLIENQSLNDFNTFLQKTGDTICGQNPIKLLLTLIQEKAFGTVYPYLIAYNTSGNKFGDFTHSVSYCAMIFSQENPEQKPLKNQFTSFEKQELKRAAHDMLFNLYEKHPVSHDFLEPFKTATLQKPMGLFVTLTKKNPKGELRGCIGRITTNMPLHQTVLDMTKAAAQNDSRFSPVQKDELENLDIALSILSQPKPAKKEDIVLGKHGIILKKGTASAVFLPEVATEFRWDLATTLNHLSKKAGLSTSAWKDPEATFEIFETLKIEN